MVTVTGGSAQCRSRGSIEEWTIPLTWVAPEIVNQFFVLQVDQSKGSTGTRKERERARERKRERERVV